MALEFNPPPAALLQEYFSRKQPAEVASEGLNNALQTYMTLKQRQATQQSGATKNIIDLIAQDPELLKTPFGQNLMKQSGGDLAGYTPPSLSSGTVPIQPVAPHSMPMDAAGSPIAGPVQGPQDSSGVGPSSPIIDHWNQTMGQTTTAKPGASEATPQPSAQDIAGMMGRGKLGKSAVGDYKTGLETQEIQRKLATDPNAPVPTMTKEEALAAGSVNPHAKILEPVDTSAKDQRREDQMAKAVTDYGKQIETNPIIKNLETQSIGLHNVEEMSHLVTQGNTVASAAMGMKMARAMGEVGVVTEQDVKRYVQSKKLTQAAGDKLNGWVNGVPSQATLGEINQITQVLGDSYQAKIQPIYNRYVDRFARAYHITPQDAASRLAIPYANTPSGSSAGGGLPEVGGMFEGGRVLSIKKVSK